MSRKASVNADLITTALFGPVLGKCPSSVHYGGTQQVRVITLNKGDFLDSTLFRLEKGWIVEFHLGPSLLGKKISVFCNHPEDFESEFERSKYRKLVWQNSGSDDDDDTGLFAQLMLRRSGSFRYYFTNNDNPESQALGSAYLTVDPVLPIGCNDSDEVLPLDSIQCQTVLAKSLGPFREWEKRLEVSRGSGYNMVHFTPIQELGGSNSSYSLQDQLNLNPVFNSPDFIPTFDDVFNLTNKMRHEWKVLSLSDIVLNHTANESPWLQQHPECTFNMKTAPHLIPAAILDGYLHVFTKEVAAGHLSRHGIPKEISNYDHLNAIKHYLDSEMIPKLKLEECYQCNIEDLGREFLEKAKYATPTQVADMSQPLTLNYTSYRRYEATVDMDLALRLYNVYRQDVHDDVNLRLSICVGDFKRRLEELNQHMRAETQHHLAAAVNNCVANIRYFRLQEDGPRIKEVSEASPLVPRYFTGNFYGYDSIEAEVYSEAGNFIMAHNGWVMNCDPLKNFAEADSNVYVRRELIAWGDSVKLRYGDKPEDSPFLWDHMRRYVEQTALLFDGIRLDNCHSTPLAVAEYLLDCGRKVRPDLYVAAELFTNSDQTDNVFVNRLGITSLIREAMSAWDSHELGRLVYRYGGEPAGSFYATPTRTITPTIAHALFLDITHDNPSPVQKKSVFDLVPSSALVAMACCATGSSRGYDELVPHHIHVVDEGRLYAGWTEGSARDCSEVNLSSGIIAVKKALNELHTRLSDEGFTQVFVDQMTQDVVAVTRHNPFNHETVILVAYTSFSRPNGYISNVPEIKNLRVEGVLAEIILETTFLCKDEGHRFRSPEGFKQDSTYINGLTDYETRLNTNITIEQSAILKQVHSGSDVILQFEFKLFQPGCVVAIRVSPHDSIKSNLEGLSLLAEKLLRSEHDEDLICAVSDLALQDINHTLYRCAQEEMEDGTGCYNIPEYGPLVYSGLQGFVSLLNDIRPNNDLGHPLCNNLRQGDWMLDYVVGRLKSQKGTCKLGLWFQKQFERLRNIPRYLIPRYFDVIVTGVYQLILSRAAFQMSEFVRGGSTFVRSLALGSVQCAGVVESAPLPHFAPSLQPPQSSLRAVTLSAGLPHFTTGYMRSWGRDTFIALRGLFILTGRYQEARFHILGYAACLRHGLIPNLLDRGVNARFNCRDSVWWWLYSIVCYVDTAPEGHDILQDPVSRIFPRDDSPPMGPGVVKTVWKNSDKDPIWNDNKVQPLHEVMQEALSVHFQGLAFRERNAGSKIDMHMTDQGFNNNVAVDLDTGFVFGGNQHNCGTWMDKMGSSTTAGNKGKPATPRDGSAVELVGLCKAVVTALDRLQHHGVYPYSGVERFDKDGLGTSWTFKQWSEKITQNFDKYFWVPSTPEEGEPRPDLVHRRGIYKDSVGASQPWADYQLRCNFPIALAVAPEICEPHKAWAALQRAEELLLGPLGMKTLDPADWNYHGDYHNDDDSGNHSVAHGFNYHQGPEWVWPVGYFLRAKLYFAKAVGGEEGLKTAVTQTRSYLSSHYKELVTSHWRGLPELTNSNGTYCADSCRVQAWSMGCLLEVMYDLHRLADNDQVEPMDK